MRDANPIELAYSMTKSVAYFRHARWRGRRICPRCGYRLLYYLKGMDASVADTNLESLPEHILKSYG